MHRRRFVMGLGAIAASPWPCFAEGLPLVGVLMATRESDAEGQARIASFMRAMPTLGWIDGQNVRIDVRWSDGNPDRTRELAQALVDLSPRVIVANGTT